MTSPRNSNNSISGANLLENVGMSYNPSEKVLDASKKRGERIREQRVYHGSGADFDRFDHSHMGEGEGAQAYGWGTYVTEVEGIGRTYAEQGRKRVPEFVYNGEEMSFSHLEAKLSDIAGTENENAVGHFLWEWNMNGSKRAKEWLAYEIKNVRDWRNHSTNPSAYNEKIAGLEALARVKGIRKNTKGNKTNLYEVEIPDDNGSNYLDWNEPLTGGQIDGIRRNLADNYRKRSLDDFDASMAEVKDAPNAAEINAWTRRGENVYKMLEYISGSPEAASEFLSQAGFTGIKYPADNMRGGRNDGKKNYVIFNEADAEITDHVRFFRTESGEAYGYTVGGKIYIDPRIATAETPIHEYAHLWASALKAGNPKEWRNVVKLMKGTSLWDEVKSRYPELESDGAIADEVLAHYSGRRGAERLREEERKAREEKDIFAMAEKLSAIDRLRHALDAFWKGVADFLHIRYTSAEEVADRVMRDLLEGVDPRKFGKEDGLRLQENEEMADFGTLSEKVTNVADLPTDMAYRETDINELEDLLKAGYMRRLPEGKTVEGAGRKFQSKNGRTFSIGKVFGNSHGGKGFAKGAPWSTLGGTLSGGTAQKVIIGVPGNIMDWQVGHHGSYKEARPFDEIEHGKPLWVKFDEEGDITDIGAEDIRAWISDEEGNYHEFIPSSRNAKFSQKGNADKEAELKKVNDDFNQRLDELVKNPNQKDKVLRLGRSSSFLKDGGIADADIELEFDRLVRKSSNDYKNRHSFEISDLKDLPLAIAEPIVVFKSTNANDHVVLTELQKDGKNFIVAVRAEEQHRKGGVVLEVNQITSLYPKKERGVVNWINTGRISNVNKEKALRFIEALQPHAGTSMTSEELISATKIINDFVNPKVGDEKSAEEDLLFRTVYGGNSGYVGYSKSKRAVQAEEEGKRSVSNFDRPFVESVNEILQSVGAEGITIAESKRLAKKTRADEWHHTSMYGNKTNYYSPETIAYAAMNESQRAAYDQRKNAEWEEEVKAFHEELEKRAEQALKEKERQKTIEEARKVAIKEVVANHPELVPIEKDGYISGYWANLDGVHVQLSFYLSDLSRRYDEGVNKKEAKRTADQYIGGLMAEVEEKTSDISRRKGEGEVTDDELSIANDPISKALGRSRFSAKQRKEFADRERARMVDRVTELAERLHLDNVEIVTDASTLGGQRAKAKGFFNPRTGKITIVVPNNYGTFDIEQTLLHEAVAHYGLRQLFGERFDTFLDNVYGNATEDVKGGIDALMKENGWSARKATEEYLASLAEDTEFENVNATWWSKVKEFFADMLRGLGFEDGFVGSLSDNELRYVLWRSYENLREPGKYKSLFSEAKDLQKQDRLQVGPFTTEAENERKVADLQARIAEEEGYLFRSGGRGNGGTTPVYDRTDVRGRYDKRVGEKSFQVQEALQDSMLSVKDYMNMVLDAEGSDRKMEDMDGFENPYVGENRLSSVNKAESDNFGKTVFKELLQEAARFARSDASRAELTDYMFAKHGGKRISGSRKGHLMPKKECRLTMYGMRVYSCTA